MAKAARASANRFREARDRACSYLQKQLRPDGGSGDGKLGLLDYYKVPVALEVSGASAEANRLCNWIRRHGITPEGDFGPRPPLAMNFTYAYFNAWVIIGAHRQGHFDLAQRGMKFLLGFWDSESGGFYSSNTERSATTKQDLFVVCGCGQAALYAGYLDVARGVGKWLKKLMEQQPDFPHLLYSVYTRADGLLLKPDPEEEIRYVTAHDSTRDNFFFNAGIAGGFLASLYKATGEIEWLNLARDYMRQAEIANDFFLRSFRAGKVAWAASVLHTLTGEGKYRDLATRIGDAFIEVQRRDGHWDWAAAPDLVIDITAELCVWLDEIHQAVGGTTN